MESKDAIFFDKNVEASVAVVPRVLCLLFPTKIKMEIWNKTQNNLQSLDNRDSRFYDVWKGTVMGVRRKTWSLLAGRKAAQHAEEAEGWEQASLCFWNANENGHNKKNSHDDKGDDEDFDLGGVRVAPVSTLPLPSLLT